MNYTTQEKICILMGEYGLSAAKFYALLDFFGDVPQLVAEFATSQYAEEVCGELYGKLRRALSSGVVESIIANMEKHYIRAVTCFSSTFPESLREIPDPPFVLFCKGNVDLLKSRCLGVVGTRKVSSYGKRVATDFVAMLSEKFTIVSGLAYGVDAIAHETTLNENGKTIAVLGGSLINVYPAANQWLAEKIVDCGGLLVSEYGIDATAKPYRFPHRNRIVSGLSLGLLVCQAPLKSGTSSTVECALDQGRDVFAVPGEIYDAGFSGNNNLIKTMQSACVTTPRDILDFYHLENVSAPEQNYQLNFEEQKVVDALSEGQLSFDKLVEKTQIAPSELNFLLANLEIKSIIARLPGNSYRSLWRN